MVHHERYGATSSGPARLVLKLAPGIQLCAGKNCPAAMVLAWTGGKIHLNQHALAILELCDGSRSRDRVVVDAMLRTGGGMRAADVVGFLDAAQARGWIIDLDI